MIQSPNISSSAFFTLLVFLFRLLLFWLLVFTLHRLFFLSYQWPVSGKIQPASHTYIGFVAGFRLDLATASLFMIIPFLLTLLYFMRPARKIVWLIGWIQGLLLLLYISVAVADAGLYREWQAKINLQALQHFRHPLEVIQILSYKLIFLYLILCGSLFWVLGRVYRYKIHTILTGFTPEKQIHVLRALSWSVVGLTIAFIGIRGSITSLPMNQSAAFFSSSPLANNLALNPVYNLLQDATITDGLPEASIYTVGSEREMEQALAEDFPKKQDTRVIPLLQETRPNILIILLESWTAEHIAALDGIEGCTPHFNQLCKQGLLFDRTYACAYVTDQGVPAVLSSYPGISRFAVINQPYRIAGLPCISEELKSAGYHNSFLYGGDLLFGNLRAYLLAKGFDQITEQKDWDHLPQGKLGVHDGEFLPALLQFLRKQPQPFFTACLTLSSHMPYDYNNKSDDGWRSNSNDPEKAFTESMHYADQQLGLFFEQAEKEPWFKHTLCILVSDHSHNSIRPSTPARAEHQRIPLLWLGGALRPEWKGKTWGKTLSQLDITAGLLHQLQLSSRRYPWSRNFAHPQAPSSAYYAFYGGVGYIRDTHFVAQFQGFQDTHTNCADSSFHNPYKQKALFFQQKVYSQLTKKPGGT